MSRPNPPARHRRRIAVTVVSIGCLLALAATALAQSYFSDPPARAYRTVLPGSGGVLPGHVVGTYASPRADSPDHLVTVTPYGLSSTLCRTSDCLDGSVNFTLVDCPTDASCIFASFECVGSVTWLDDGTLLLTSSPSHEGRELDAGGLCTAFAGTAVPVGPDTAAPPTAPTPIPDSPVALVPEDPVTGDPCDVVAALAGEHERQPVAVDEPVFSRGPDDALVTVVEFSDFQCPYCARVTPTLNELLAEFPADVRLVFRHRPLAFHTAAPLAHQASLAAAEQGRFWEMHDLIFNHQRTLDRATLERHATSLGLDLTRFRAYLDEARGQSVIDAHTALADRVGARGTPNFFINGRQLQGAQPLASFRDLVQDELDRARQMADAGLDAETIYACLTGN